MAKYEFARAHTGMAYGVFFPKRGDAVELDEGFAADGVAQGLLKAVPVEVDKPKRGRPGKAE